MNNVFALLCIVSACLLIISLASPKIISKFAKNPIHRHHAGIGFGLLTGLFLILTGISMPMSSPAETAASIGAPVTKMAQAESRSQETAVQRPIITSTTVEQSVPYTTQTIPDNDLAKDSTALVIKGVNGIKTQTYAVTKLEDKEIDRKLVKEEMTQQPVNEITKVGTKVEAPAPTSTSAQILPTAPSTTPSTSKNTTNTQKTVSCPNKSGAVRKLLNSVLGKTSSC